MLKCSYHFVIWQRSSKFQNYQKFKWLETFEYECMSHLPHFARYSEHIDGLVQERRNSTANTLELRLSCTKPSICLMWYWNDPQTSHHYDVIKWKQFPRYWPFVRGIHQSPVNSPHKGQWRGALVFSLICVWINGGVNNREAGDLRHYHAHYDATVMMTGYRSAGCWLACCLNAILAYHVYGFMHLP